MFTQIRTELDCYTKMMKKEKYKEELILSLQLPAFVSFSSTPMFIEMEQTSSFSFPGHYYLFIIIPKSLFYI